VNFNVQACAGRRSFGGDCSSSYYLAAFARPNSYLGGLNTYSDLGFPVARVPAIPEPSTLVIWSLLGDPRRHHGLVATEARRQPLPRFHIRAVGSDVSGSAHLGRTSRRTRRSCRSSRWRIL
jgi:hypothetical protein